MYSNLYVQMIRPQQQALAARADHPRHVQELRAGAGPRTGRIHRRAARAVAALAVCAAASSVVAISDAGANPRPTGRGGHVSAAQLERETRALEAKGYVPTACTVNGTEMRNYSSGQSLTVGW